jgi:hypothetical protein
MRNIDIQITKSRLENYHVTFDKDDKINISCTIGLYTDAMKKISEYSLSTNAWNNDNKFEMPISVRHPIKKIGEALEIVATLKCREGQLALTSGDEF